MAKKRYGTRRSADHRLRVPEMELVTGILRRIPGAHASAVLECIESGNYKAAAELRVDPRGFSDPLEFSLALLSVSLFRKYPGFPGVNNKVDDAIEKWRACEEQCRSTNERIRQSRAGYIQNPHAEVFRLARSKIAHLLGSFSWSKVAKHFDFGPGSTTRLSYARRHLPFKFGPEPQTTLDNLATAMTLIGSSRAWTMSTGGRYVDGPAPCFRICEQSKVTTVPKDAFIDRVIAIEPDMNMFVQKGFGGYIRRRLKWAKINLDDQSLNQLLARDASRGGLATLDLSSASDTVSYELVKELLPPDWFEALLSCRTHESRLPSQEIVPLEKFSAMGNGYTFELESLIFWALCSSVCTDTIGREGLRAAVYGDDIVISVTDYASVVDLLVFSGFSVNPKKSFSDGPYRESCGKHYFHGHDVTPITITKELTHVSRLLLLCNNIQRWCYIRGNGQYRDAILRDLYRYCVGQLPAHLRRPRIPLGYGDGALVGSFDEVLPRRAPRHGQFGGWCGWVCPSVLLPRSTSRRASGVATLAASLSKLDNGASSPELFQDPACARGFYPLLAHTDQGFPHFEGISRLYAFLGREPVNREEVRGFLAHKNLVGLGRRLLVSFKGGTAVFVPLERNVLEVATFADSDLCGDTRAKQIENLFPQAVALASEYEANVRYELGRVFVKQWCDIGPWVP